MLRWTAQALVPARRSLSTAENRFVLEAEATPLAGKAEHVIFIWLGGGMAQIDTFDPKRRGNSAIASRAAITTRSIRRVEGVQVTEHLKHSRRQDGSRHRGSLRPSRDD